LNLEAALEALLFSSDQPLSAALIGEALDVEVSQVLAGLQALGEAYAARDAGVELREIAGGWMFVTTPAQSEWVGRMLRGKRRMRLSPEAQHLLLAYHWPGNVRELMNVLERGVALCQGELIADEDLPPHVREKRPADFLGAAVARRMTLAELEREFIERVLEDEAGNKTRAAQRLGLDRKTLYRKLDEYARARGEIATPAPVPPTGDPE